MRGGLGKVDLPALVGGEHRVDHAVVKVDSGHSGAAKTVQEAHRASRPRAPPRRWRQHPLVRPTPRTSSFRSLAGAVRHSGKRTRRADPGKQVADFFQPEAHCLKLLSRARATDSMPDRDRLLDGIEISG
jgi:hypothetical protein